MTYISVKAKLSHISGLDDYVKHLDWQQPNNMYLNATSPFYSKC